LDFGSGLGTTAWAIDTVWGGGCAANRSSSPNNADGGLDGGRGSSPTQKTATATRSVNAETPTPAAETPTPAAEAAAAAAAAAYKAAVDVASQVGPGRPELLCLEPSLEMYDLASELTSCGPYRAQFCWRQHFQLNAEKASGLLPNITCAFKKHW
jgi:hypothetical protein